MKICIPEKRHLILAFLTAAISRIAFYASLGHDNMAKWTYFSMEIINFQVLERSFSLS